MDETETTAVADPAGDPVTSDAVVAEPTDAPPPAEASAPSGDMLSTTAQTTDLPTVESPGLDPIFLGGVALALLVGLGGGAGALPSGSAFVGGARRGRGSAGAGRTG